MDEIRFIAAGGSLGGSGVHAEPIREAMRHNPHFIAQDAGSTDGGPYYLGAGKTATSRQSMRHDLELVIGVGAELGIPVVIGSAGTAGADVHVDWMFEIVREVVAGLGKPMRTARIYAEQDKGYLTDRLREGRISPLRSAPDFDEATIARSSRIVGMMGTEQIQQALEGGAQIVLAGRCSDAAVFAAIPIMRGFPAGLAWHAGKVLECGTMACETRGKGAMLATLTHDDLVITPIGENLRCTPQSLAAHSLYENADPYLHKECSGTLDLTDSRYESVDDRSVRITGSAYRPADYTVKLEGSERVGFQTLVICGIRDPFIIAELDDWLAGAREVVAEQVHNVTRGEVGPDGFELRFIAYGRDAVMRGLEPEARSLPHEIGLVMEITAPTQERAAMIATIARKRVLHYPIGKWKGGITGIALLHNPPELERGPVYRFNVNHVVSPRSPHEMFRTQFLDLA